MNNLRIRRFFRFLNQALMVPLFRLGLGPFIGNPFTGYIMVLRTIGRKTGQARYTPVNYALLNGCIYCVRGLGKGSHWYRNLWAHPEIEVILPGGPVAGRAAEVTDPAESLTALRQILKNAGLAGFFLGFNPFTAPEALLREKTKDLPVVRIQPSGIGNGAADPGGWLWLWNCLEVLLVAGVMWWLMR